MMYKKHRGELLKTAQVKSKSRFSLGISTKPPFGHAQQYPQSQPLLASMATNAVGDHFLLQTSLALYTATLGECQTEIHFRKWSKAMNCGVYHYYGYSYTCLSSRAAERVLLTRHSLDQPILPLQITRPSLIYTR